MPDEITYSRRELLAGMQMLEWALVQIYVLGVNEDTQTKAHVHRDPESIRALKLIDLMMDRGHHWFRDMIADFAPMHAEGEHLGMAAAKITDYQRSHDIIWTQCFMNACVDLTDDGFVLRSDWERQAIIIWMNIGKEIRAGILPDFDPSVHAEYQLQGKD